MSRSEDDFWKAQILAVRRGQLDAVRKAATAWAGVLTGVLGVFGTVSFVGGLNGLTDLEEPLKLVFQIGLLAAAGCALVATILFASAANSFPGVSTKLTIDEYQVQIKRRAQSALTRFRVALPFAAAAALIVVVGSSLLVFAPKAKSPGDAPFVISVIEGEAHCGKLSKQNGQLSVDGQALRTVDSITIVAACP